MIPGGNKSPYRLPCEGSVNCFNGRRYQHALASEMNVPVFICDTLLPVEYIPPRGDTAPYERYNDLSGGPGCADDLCGGGAPAPCIAWIGTGGDGTQFDLEFPPPMDTFYQPKMVTGITIAAAGMNYHAGDVLAVSGGTASNYVTPDGGPFSAGATITVGSVSVSGGILSAAVSARGSYSSPPGSPNSPGGGHGTGAEFNLTLGNQTENLSPCQKIGYKNVQAKRQWHGFAGWMSAAACGPTSSIGVYTCTDAPCAWNFFNEYDLAAPQSKYTGVSLEIDYSVTSPFGSPGCTDSLTAEWHVDSTSGLIIVDSLDYGTGAAAGATVVTGYDTFGDPTLSTGWDIINLCALGLLEGLVTVNKPDGESTDISCSDLGASWVSFGFAYTESWTVGDSVSFMFSNIDMDGFGESYDVSVSNGSLSFVYYQNTGGPDAETVNFSVTASLSGSNTAEDVISDVYTLLDEWDLTNDTVYPWRSDSYTSIAPLVMRNEPANNVSPLDMIPWVVGSTPIDDCYGYDPSSPDWTPSYAATEAVDPNTALCDGSIIGTPLPAGYQQTFDWYYTDWESCDDTGHGDFVGFIEGWGKRNIGQNGIPRTATHWTSNDLAWRLTGGAWIFYNCDTAYLGCTDATWPGPGVIIAQKWAETKVSFPSENFARPGGDDKFVFDESRVFTVKAITGSGTGATVQLQMCPSCVAPGVLLTDHSGLWGGPVVGGFYEISAYDGTDTVTLGTKVYSVPSTWESASDGDTDFCFGKLRWSTGTPATDPPPILGRAGISAVTEYMGNPAVAELSTDLLPNLGMGVSAQDSVDVLDGSMSALGSGLAVTRVDDSHFTVPVAAGGLANARWLVSHGAANYKWDDQYPKGDYVYNDFTYWPRLICEAQRWNSLVSTCEGDDTCACPDGSYTEYCFPFYNPFEDSPGVFDHAFTLVGACIAFNPCSPSVLYITPNDEVFANGTKYSFPVEGGVFLDESYGSGWYAEFQQVIVDPLYETPHYPASGVGDCDPTDPPLFSWLMDDGGCEADDPGATPPVEYFAHAPVVEARLTVPAGAPGLPSGIALGWVSPAGVTTCSPIPSDMLFPPGVNGYGLSAGVLVWGLWSLECGCVAANGRFADVYENDVVGCS